MWSAVTDGALMHARQIGSRLRTMSLRSLHFAPYPRACALVRVVLQPGFFPIAAWASQYAPLQRAPH